MYKVIILVSAKVTINRRINLGQDHIHLFLVVDRKASPIST